MKQVCIVGAGTAGLCSARRFLERQTWCVTIYEQTDKVGGTWCYTDQIGYDDYGLDVHSSMYQGLKTNLPKEVMGFPDFAIADCFESYVDAAAIEHFLESYADKHKLYDYIKFLHYIIRITPTRNKKWQIIVKDLKNDRIDTQLYDYVLICNGHYHTPFYPSLKDSDLYKGQQIHSHDYRNSKRFQDESVLIIGAGPSGMDLCNEISKVAKLVTLSHHMPGTIKTQFRSNVNQKPDVKSLSNSYRVEFIDGTSCDYTVILYCSGFKYAFPFLSVDCGIHVDDNYVQPLYKHCININQPTMAFIGIPYYVCFAQMCDLQVRFVLKFWSGEKILPDPKTMLMDTNKLMEAKFAKGLRKRHAHMMGEEQGLYYDDLATTADIENIKPVMTELHNESSRRFMDDLLNFRKDVFRIIDDENYIKIQ